MTAEQIAYEAARDAMRRGPRDRKNSGGGIDLRAAINEAVAALRAHGRLSPEGVATTSAP